MSWQWWVAQAFAFICLIFVVVSNQQKTTKRLIWFRNIATGFNFIGLCFLGQLSAIIMCGAGVIRNAVSLYFAYKPDTKNFVKVIAGCLIIALLIVLNIIFWKNLYNLYSILLGALLVVTFLQRKPKTIRILALVAETFSIIYYALLLTPINVVIEVFGFVSALVGIIRLDIKKKNVEPEVVEESEEVASKTEEVVDAKES